MPPEPYFTLEGFTFEKTLTDRCAQGQPLVIPKAAAQQYYKAATEVTIESRAPDGSLQTIPGKVSWQSNMAMALYPRSMDRKTGGFTAACQHLRLIAGDTIHVTLTSQGKVLTIRFATIPRGWAQRENHGESSKTSPAKTGTDEKETPAGKKRKATEGQKAAGGSKQQKSGAPSGPAGGLAKRPRGRPPLLKHQKLLRERDAELQKQKQLLEAANGKLQEATRRLDDQKQTIAALQMQLAQARGSQEANEDFAAAEMGVVAGKRDGSAGNYGSNQGAWAAIVQLQEQLAVEMYKRQKLQGQLASADVSHRALLNQLAEARMQLQALGAGARFRTGPVGGPAEEERGGIDKSARGPPQGPSEGPQGAAGATAQPLQEQQDMVDVQAIEQDEEQQQVNKGMDVEVERAALFGMAWLTQMLQGAAQH